MQACVDDPIASSIPSELEGECTVGFQLRGMPLETAMSRTAGNAVNSIGSLYVLFYPVNGNGTVEELKYAFTTDPSCANDIFTSTLSVASTTSEDRTGFNPGGTEWNGSAESATQKVTTSQVQVRRGNYKIYVAANVGAFSSATMTRASVATPQALRNFSLTWNASNVAANNAMFGFFTESSTQGYDVINEDAPTILLSDNSVTVHAWVKRVASKVTVAFDGSQLNDNVNVYIKKVSIKDIPRTVKLGATNTPSAAGDLIATGEQTVYTTTGGVTNTTRISKREPYFPNFTGYTDDEQDVAQWRNKVHSETANALFFFENAQGKSTGGANGSDPDGSWKQQTDSNGNGIPDDRDTEIHPGIDSNTGILKDTKAYGTYVEVEAYYTNANFGSQTEGNIVYRFMLGMNTTDDFNAWRNNHYKLTLCLRNNANDVDWHIDYSDQPGEYIPDVIYVSYTYNTATILPIRIVGQSVSDMSVTINSSNWYPDDSSIPQNAGPADPAGLASGFLSLTYDENPRIKDNEQFNANQDYISVGTYWNTQPNNTTRTYLQNSQKVNWTDLDAHGYSVQTRRTSEGNQVFEANIPMFTRPLVIYKACAWSGANPYYSSERTARVTLSYTLNGTRKSKVVTVKQVRRVENPAGIYRRHDNASPFDVTLMGRNGEGGTHSTPISYYPIVSDGAWRATIYRSNSGNGMAADNTAWFSIRTGSQRVSTVGQYLQGDDDSQIQFTYVPNGTTSQNNVRTGIIKVEYNNYTCTHYIFVRQGYAPMQLEAGRVYWHSFNLYSASEETSHPCEAGSFFLRGNWSPAILDSNSQGFGVAATTLQCITNDAGTATGTVNTSTMNSSNTRGNFSAGTRTLSRNSAYTPWNTGRIPTVAEWTTLLNENANALVNRAFGVLYADGATTTQTSPVEVYGCLHSDVVNGTNGYTSRGMRGTFVYNSDNGRNLFFPIGAMGYGRRKVADRGILQYGHGDSYNTLIISSNRRCLLYNLWTNEGAIYWGQAQVTCPTPNVDNTNAWDINYKSYDFDYMDASVNATSSSYIRLVQDTAP